MKNIFRKVTLIFLILIFAILIFKGCVKNHTYKYFDFEDATIKNSVGEVTIGLRGNFALTKNGLWKITHKGNPYELCVWLETSQEIKEEIVVNQIVIVYKNGSLVTTHEGGQFSTKWSTFNNAYHGGWWFDDVKLDHKVISVTLNIVIPLDGKKIEQKIEVELRPKYKEEKRNDFIDTLMSV